jgi:probable F420-dependent oxidoreductase
MKLGIYPSVTRGDGDLARLFDELCEEAVVAEESGFTWCLVGEHHQEPALSSPLLTAAMVAMRTRKIRIGTAVMLLPLHHPVHAAEQAALIDVLSHGRLVLGVGAGYQEKDFATFGVPMRNRSALLDESVEILRRYWTQSRLTFTGNHFRFEGVVPSVRPMQLPSIPIWIGANSEAALARVAAMGDAWIASRTKTIATVREWAGTYRAAARRLGKPAEVYVIRDAWIAEDRGEAIQGYERALRNSLHYYAGNEAYVRQTESMLAARAAGREPEYGDTVIVGSPDDCTTQVARWASAGVDGLLLRFRHPGGPPHSDILSAIRMFGRSWAADGEAGTRTEAGP